MRILHVTPHYYPSLGGSDVHIKELSERLARRGHEVTVLTANSWGLNDHGGKDRLSDSEVINGVNVHRFRAPGRVHKWFQQSLNIRGAHRILSLAVGGGRLQMLANSPISMEALGFTLRARHDIAAVINWYYGSLAYQTCVARRISGLPLVGIPLSHTDRQWTRSDLYVRMLSDCDAVAANTDHEKRFIEGRSGQRNVHVVGVGIDPAQFANVDARTVRRKYQLGDAPLVGYVGRMAANKGVVTLIEAMKEVWRTVPAARLLLAGSGLPGTLSCQEEITRVFQTLSPAERERVIGIGSFTDSEKAGIFAALDIFAMPSTAESFGIAYLEAWACRKPVIGARIGSTACVIEDGVDGALVDPEKPDDLARAILRLLGDRTMRNEMGRTGHMKTITNFTWDKVTDKIERLYDATRARSYRDDERAIHAESQRHHSGV